MRLTIFHWLLAVVAAEVTVAAVLVGPSRFTELPWRLRERLRESAPYVVLLAATAAGASTVRQVTASVSWLVGLNVTPLIHAIEGETVAWIQSFASPPLTAFLAFTYVFGFAFLLIFPVLLYLTLEDPRPFRGLALAFVFNDLIGLVAFTALISYGPRNAIPGAVEPILFSTFPETMILNTAATANTNVFPSMHTSLAVTVAYMAWRTRETVPRWWYIALPVAASIVLATMYLGIHWVIDVLGGVALGVGSVRLAERSIEREYVPRLVLEGRRRLARRTD